MADKIRWVDQQRFDFILEKLGEGTLSRGDIVTRFQVTPTAVSAIFKRFEAARPGHMRYDVHAKRYVPGPNFKDPIATAL